MTSLSHRLANTILPNTTATPPTRDRIYGTAIGKRGMHSREVNTRLTRVPVDHCGIPEILTESEVRRKEISM
jgi:hypothetical protein